MKDKAKSVKEFVERIDSTKKVNPKDLSSDQDLTIAIMNLISIEEHLVFSGAKTGKTAFYDLIEEVRETRKNLMQKIIPSYEGEVWCISKHLLATSMRLLEVGTKQQSLGNTEQAYDLFNKSYDMYCLFWGLNMNMLKVEDLKWVETSIEDVKKITAKINENTAKVANDKQAVQTQEVTNEKTSALSKMKAFVRKAVDCCIE
ncbi:MAG: hypothetical protein IJF12_02760 [Alphaproteobacteria bacterium]|nr:hypothetical protein [Alphaproteobacteria bacterium]MBQ2811069.1 hypothetical protein [Alphaproteobacteria bacterium]